MVDYIPKGYLSALRRAKTLSVRQSLLWDRYQNKKDAQDRIAAFRKEVFVVATILCRRGYRLKYEDTAYLRNALSDLQPDIASFCNEFGYKSPTVR